MERYFEVNEKGHNIRCKLYCADLAGIRRAVLFLHGFAGHKDTKAAARLAERLMNKTKGTALVTFNWPCHGDDVKKKLTLADCDTYLELVTAYIRERYHAEEISVCAVSFGAYVLLRNIAAHGSPYKRIVLRSPALPMYDSLTGTIMTADEREKIARGQDVQVGFDRRVPVSRAFLDEVRECDVRKMEFFDQADDMLIIHGTKDELIPFEGVREFAENNVIELAAVEGADHRFQDPKKMDAALKAMFDFGFFG